MKKIILISFFSLIVINGNCQEFTLQISPTLSNIFHYQFVAGGPGGNAKLGLALSFECYKSSFNKISFGFGLNYQFSRVEIVPEPFLQAESHLESVHLVSASIKWPH